MKVDQIFFTISKFTTLDFTTMVAFPVLILTQFATNWGTNLWDPKYYWNQGYSSDLVRKYFGEIILVDLKFRESQVVDFQIGEFRLVDSVWCMVCIGDFFWWK